MFPIQRAWRWIATGALSLALLPIGAAQAATPDVAPEFRGYYYGHEGIRVLGNPLTDVMQVDGNPAQYFEKGRIEDHRDEVANPDWRYMYGRLTAELMERAPQVQANSTQITYGSLKAATLPQGRTAAPAGFTGGTMAVSGGRFIPYDSQLRAAAGYVVPDYFWSYINRADLFPGGWLHDIGLPMTAPMAAATIKNGERRDIVMQAFERTVLTYDPRNPRDWQIERGNIGTDLVRVLGQQPQQPQQPSQNTPEAARGSVQQFLHNVTVDARAAETGWYDFLSRNAKARYIGTGRVAGSGWINRLLGIQNTPPDCVAGNEARCLVQIAENREGKALFDARTGQILVRWTWGNGDVSDRVFKMVFEDGWKLDEVTGVDIAADNRLGGEAQVAVAGFFKAWQQGDAASAMQTLTLKLRSTISTESQIRAWLSVGSAPRLVRVQLESVRIPQGPASAVVKANLIFADGSTTERRFEVVEVGANSMAINNVLP